jgi:hypothetical protein
MTTETSTDAALCAACGAAASTGGTAYPVAVTTAGPSGGVLHRDEYGCAASYYGRVVAMHVRRGCPDATCPEFRG